MDDNCICTIFVFALFIHVVTKHAYRSYQMMRKDLYMIALVSQVYKEIMEGRLVLQGYVHIHVFHVLQSQYELVTLFIWWYISTEVPFVPFFFSHLITYFILLLMPSELIRLILLIYSIHSLVVLMEYLELVMKGASTSILETRETMFMIFGNDLLNTMTNFWILPKGLLGDYWIRPLWVRVLKILFVLI